MHHTAKKHHTPEFYRKRDSLAQYLHLVREYDTLEKIMLEHRTKMISIKANTISDMPIQDTGFKPNKMDQGLIKLEKLENMMKTRMFDLIDMRCEIEYGIASLHNSLDRTIVTMRYVCGYTKKRIMKELNYSERQLRRMHNDAVERMRF